MTIAVSCQCGQRFAVKEELAGKKGKCPKCGTIFRIPSASSSPPPPPPSSSPPPPPASNPLDDFAGLGSMFDEEGIGVAGRSQVGPGQGKLCPECRKVVPVNALLCVECGWNFEENMKLETKRGKVKNPLENPYGVDPYFDEEDSDLYTGRKRRLSSDTGNRQGPPWEVDHELITKYFQTVIDILLKPNYAFSQMSLDGGFGPPITFVLVGYVIAYILITVLLLGFISFLGTMPITGQQIPPGTIAAMGACAIVGMCFAVIAFLIVAGILFPILMFISSSILHLFLMCVGAGKRGLEPTFRAAGYVSGALVLPAVFLGIIPLIGEFLSLILQGIYTIIAVKYTHSCNWWQAMIATVLWGLVIVAIIVAFRLGMADLLEEQIRVRNERLGLP